MAIATTTTGIVASTPAGQRVDSAAPRLHVGGRAVVLPGDPNALNTKPVSHSVDATSQRRGLIQPGETVDVVGGPVCANGITWWQVIAHGTTGWTGEMQGTTYWLGPAN